MHPACASLPFDLLEINTVAVPNDTKKQPKLSTKSPQFLNYDLTIALDVENSEVDR